MPNIERLSKDDILKLALEGYSHELKALIKLAQSNLGTEIIPLFNDYDSFLKDKRAAYLGENILQTLVNNNLIDATNQTHSARKLFACANLAASCEVFSGWTIPLKTINVHHSDEYLNMATSAAAKTQDNLGQSMAVRLNNSDTVRVIQLLKLLGLLKKKPSCFQLSTGSSIGIRDRIATHVTPHITINHFLNDPPLRFKTIQSEADDIVLIDNDINMKTTYEQLSTANENTYALNKDVYIGLEEVAGLVASNKLRPRTLVTAYRLEPRAYTNTGRYISSIGRVIDSKADFLTTIGSGDTDREFADRKRIINELFDELSGRGMNPLRIKLHQGESIKQQRINPLFGLNQYTSYEILYCKLDKNLFNTN